MKFRYKVMISNLWLLSLGLGLIGYLMIHKNFELAKDAQMQNAISENNLVQSMVEYELLGYLNDSGFGIEEQLQKIGEMVAGNMMQTTSSFYIKFGGEYVYASDEGQGNIDDLLFQGMKVGDKNYVIKREKDSHYIYITSYSEVNQKELCIVCRRDISDIYALMDNQVAYFRILMVLIMLAASALMYGISAYLTGPLEKLNRITDEIAAGNYDTRVTVKSRDEIGFLAEKFNQMAEAVEEHVEELNDMVHRREQFVADFTHEIKTPMTTIIGYADTMRSMNLPREEEIMSLNYIFKEGRRLEMMSRKLFELIYLNQHEIEMQPIHVVDMGKEIAGTVTPALKEKGIELVTELEAAKIMGNKELLVTVFINLIDNARKASSTEGRILFTGKRVEQATGTGARKETGQATDIGARKETGQATGARQENEVGQGKGYELCVRDFGIGMTEEDAAKICDEFYMVDKSRTRKEGGAGLGMSLVALIVKRHGAHLTVESKPNEGTAMRITFYDVIEEEEGEEWESEEG